MPQKSISTHADFKYTLGPKAQPQDAASKWTMVLRIARRSLRISSAFLHAAEGARVHLRHRLATRAREASASSAWSSTASGASATSPHCRSRGAGAVARANLEKKRRGQWWTLGVLAMWNIHLPLQHPVHAHVSTGTRSSLLGVCYPSSSVETQDATSNNVLRFSRLLDLEGTPPNTGLSTDRQSGERRPRKCHGELPLEVPCRLQRLSSNSVRCETTEAPQVHFRATLGSTRRNCRSKLYKGATGDLEKMRSVDSASTQCR